MMESEFRLQWSRTLISYIWGQNREEHLLATSDHFELTVSDFFIVKITVVLWKQGKMTQYVRSAVSTAVMPEGEIIWGCPVGFPLSRDFSNFQVPGLSGSLGPVLAGPRDLQGL